MTEKQRYHFIGIGGIGMSGLARILLQRGVAVSGSDAVWSAAAEQLHALGAQVFTGHDASYVPHGAVVVYSSAITEDNPEYSEAFRRQQKLMHRSELLATLVGSRQSLAVTGTHGKTTTSCLLTWLLLEAQRAPSYALGGVLLGSDVNAVHGVGDLFVMEADESDGSFLNYHPYGAIITNVDDDHMDHYGSYARLEGAFRQFAGQVSSPQHLFWYGDDPTLKRLELAGMSYGFGQGCDLRVLNFRQKGWSVSFDLAFEGHHFDDVEVPLVGQHNALNAVAVFGLAVVLGVSEEAIRGAFASFGGVGRRCQKKGEEGGVLVLDDYAHHPTEIAATLAATRAACPDRRLVAVFQPHRYSRTRHCLGAFGGAFSQADVVVVTDLYAAGETPIKNVSHLSVLDEVADGIGQYIPRQHLAEKVKDLVVDGDVVVTLGAGDVTAVGGELVALLSSEKITKTPCVCS